MWEEGPLNPGKGEYAVKHSLDPADGCLVEEFEKYKTVCSGEGRGGGRGNVVQLVGWERAVVDGRECDCLVLEWVGGGTLLKNIGGRWESSSALRQTRSASACWWWK
uniref:Protein kinase domain-containing protein n=1 Tax=Chromera velia CCMP2878 TaxID=1169474 RepID=A0A0G4FRJ8_9ALVE|eukprot:Cvel_18406.t1-p1 / transcript=Cvel_18406.t1 / gene=Cvel_18406 / organism=Chromera_velia_CCMP2878 / gene_product=hypothetical protein / transcript_product=hypothetical protein / location=Cvel_scaffold1522:21523-24240(-) / protein_length=106 / sequence_SO=supercontig / SO=protein_coding / is_pseudo=false